MGKTLVRRATFQSKLMLRHCEGQHRTDYSSMVRSYSVEIKNAGRQVQCCCIQPCHAPYCNVVCRTMKGVKMFVGKQGAAGVAF